MTFGEKLQYLRKANGFSQEQLAEQIAISRQAVSKWELNTSFPDADKLKKLSRLFGVSINYLLDNESIGTSDMKSLELNSADTNIVSPDIKLSELNSTDVDKETLDTKVSDTKTLDSKETTDRTHNYNPIAEKVKKIWIKRSNRLCFTALILFVVYGIIVEYTYLSVPLIPNIRPYYTIVSTALMQLILITLTYLIMKSKERKASKLGYFTVFLYVFFFTLVKPYFEGKDSFHVNEMIQNKVHVDNYSIGQVVASFSSAIQKADKIMIIELIGVIILTIAITIKYVNYKNECYMDKYD